MLFCAVLLAAAWMAPHASGAATGWVRSQPVQMRTLAIAADLPVTAAADASHQETSARATSGRRAGATGSPLVATLDAGMRFTMAGVICDPPAITGPVTIRLRTSTDGSTWSLWHHLPLERAQESGGRPQAFTDPFWTGAARYVQVSATGAAGAPEELSGVRVVALDPSGGDDTASAAGAVRHAVAAPNAPPIVSRANWGADESLRSGTPSYATVKMAFIHHTAGSSSYAQADAPALVRGIYAYHTKSLGWSDIGYNFLIDRFGTIYEGRHGGITKGVVGAQVLGFNTGSTGVSVMGTFTDEAPPPEAVNALERLLAWELALHGLDPAGTATLICGASEKYAKGTAVTFPVIAGHRQANFTECPGTRLYALLPTIRSEVGARPQAPIVATLAASSPLVSPNADGVLDTTSFTITLSAPATWALRIRAASGAAVRSFGGNGTAAEIAWDGLNDAGKHLPDGTYTVELSASAGQHAAKRSSVAITIDTVAPRLTSASVDPGTFSPNGDGQTEKSAVSYAPAETCDVRLSILDADGKVARWLGGWRSSEATTFTSDWDGLVSDGGKLVPAAEGRYRFRIERRDEAGNIARRGCAVVVDRTLGFPKVTPSTISPNGDGTRDAATIGFTLTRRATVQVTISLESETRRTLELGSLGAGARGAVWDGAATAGATVANGQPRVTITATSTLGTTTVSRALIVDNYQPHLYAAAGKKAALGSSVRMTVKALDPFSDQVDLRYRITNARGQVIASGHPGWVATDESVAITWKPRARGVYTATYRATDRGGNREAAPAATRLTVR